jgi:hypothetical protein
MPIKKMNWDAHCGQRVRIYRNLNNGRMSIQAKINGSWKVVGHVLDAVLQEVKFHISESGRQRVIRDGCKNVHAWGEGILVGEVDASVDAPIDLAYNPYTNSTFIERGTSHPITTCNFLIVQANQVFVSLDAVSGTGDRPILTLLPGGQRNKVTAKAVRSHQAIAA